MCRAALKTTPLHPQQQRREREQRKLQEKEQQWRLEDMQALRREEERRQAEREQVQRPQHTPHTPLPCPGLPARSCCLPPCSPVPCPPSFPNPRFLLSFLASLFLSVFSHPSTPNPGSLPSSCLCAFIPHLLAHPQLLSPAPSLMGPPP